MTAIAKVTALFAGKPQPFGPRASLSSIVKQKHESLQVTKLGATADEQGNKKLHGGVYMALHQYAQNAYQQLSKAFPDTSQDFNIGTIGENLSAPNMQETNVFIGDHYKVGSVILQTVSPRAPCSRINQRYGKGKIDQYIAEHNLTGWYFSVIQEGTMSTYDDISLIHREKEAISVEQIWRLRKIKQANGLSDHTTEQIKATEALVQKAAQLQSLSPEWQGYMQRTLRKVQSTKS